MNIRCYMIKSNKEVTILKVSPSSSHFKFNNGIYTINKDIVALSHAANTNLNPVPELVYVEGNPLPLNLKAGNVSDFLEKIVIENALKQISKPIGGFMVVIVDYLRHPSKIMLLGFSLLVLAAILYAVLSGGF